MKYTGLTRKIRKKEREHSMARAAGVPPRGSGAELRMAFATLLALALAGCARAQTVGIPDFGTIQGAPCSGYPNASMYLGVPYATAVRFAPPVMWAQSYPSPYLLATTFPPACVQRAKAGYALAEDCLVVNVFAPTTDAIGVAVRVYIHGGWFQYGSASSGSSLNDDYLNNSCRMVSQTGTIFVTIQYRLGVFGFLSHPATYAESGTTGTWGILDQQMALQWVSKYIQYFGGNPNKVTLEGQNAGAISIAIHMISQKSWPYFQAAIASNGAAIQLLTPDRAYGFTTTLADGVGCPTNNEQKQLECLRQQPWQKLVDGTHIVKATFQPINRVFFPVVDGKVIPAQPTALFAKGKINPVPFMAILNSHEGSTFVRGSYNNPEGAITPQYIEGFVQSLYSCPGSSDNILANYPTANYPSNVERFADIWQDMFITCPTVRQMRSLAAYQVPAGSCNPDSPLFVSAGSCKIPQYLMSFRHKPECPAGARLAGPGTEQDLAYILNLDFVINKQCLLTPEERPLAYDIMYGYGMAAQLGAPQFANGTQWPLWDPVVEMVTVADVPALTRAPMPELNKCKIFDVPTCTPSPPPSPSIFPVDPFPPPPVVLPPSQPVVQCYMLPAVTSGSSNVDSLLNSGLLGSTAADSSTVLSVINNVGPQSIICFDPTVDTPFQTSKLTSSKAAHRIGQGPWLPTLQALIAGAVAVAAAFL